MLNTAQTLARPWFLAAAYYGGPHRAEHAPKGTRPHGHGHVHQPHPGRLIRGRFH